MTADATETNKRPVLLIHGAWHGAWCWERWSEALKSRGFEHVIPVELRGHGYKVGEYKHARLKDYVSDVKTLISNLNTPPILIGHSLGCSIIQELMAEQQYPGVVLLAPIPQAKLFRAVFAKQLVRHPLLSLSSIIQGNMNPWVSSRKSPQLFFSEYIPVNEAQKYTDKMQGESFRLFLLDLLQAPPASKIGTPMLTVAAQNDHFFSVAAQRKTAEGLGSDFMVAPNSGHDIMLDIANNQVLDEVIDWLHIHTQNA